MTQHELEEELIKNLQQVGIESPRLEAKWIFEKIGLVEGDKNVSLNKQEEVWSFFDRRSKGEPLAYVLEERGFYKEIFCVKEGVLIPRPETEILVEQSLSWLKNSVVDDPMVFDFGCGTGCIGISVIKEHPKAKLKAFDLSPIAIEVTEKNSHNLKVSDRCDVFLKPVEEISFSEFGRADVILANPPYIANNDPEVWESVHKFEPQMALYSGPTGLEKIKVWSERALDLLCPGGFFAMEFGKDQGPSVVKVLQDLSFKEIKVIKDLAGIDRVVTANKEN